MKRIARCSLLALVTSLNACGGKSPSSSPPTIQILSPGDGRRVTNGNRELTVSGAGSRMASVTVKLNGAALPGSAVSFTDSAFTAALTLANNRNDIEAIATSADGSTASAAISVVYPFVTFTTFQPASVVVGQETPFANADNPPANNTISYPTGRALVSGGKLYLPDTGHNRVLVYDSVPTANGARADMVLGQQTFDTAISGTGGSEFAGPMTVASDAGKLLVADFGNGRVDVFDALPDRSGQSADVIVGQTRFGFPVDDCTGSTLSVPGSVFAVNGKLIVADDNHHRVLIWNSMPTIDGALANLVLGQEAFGSCYANAGGSVYSPGSVSANTLHYPTDVWSDGTRMVVTDRDNNRVLIWNTFPTENGAPANIVLGQSEMTGSSPEDRQTGLNGPWSVSSNGNQLFVADSGNNRVLIWNSFPTTDNAQADLVLGQGDLIHVTCNDDQQGDVHSGPSARTLCDPEGVALWGNQLFVADGANNRYLIYNGE
jgi:hypothetical protein